MDLVLGKIIDLSVDWSIIFLSKFFKAITPLRIFPKNFFSPPLSNWNDILDLTVENKLNSNIYNVFVEGSSEEEFDIKIISDNWPNRKTLEHSATNTDLISVFAQHERRHLWLFRINKLEPKGKLTLRVKVSNIKPIKMSVLQYSAVEIPVKEHVSGAAAIPFNLKKYPNIKNNHWRIPN